MDTDMEAIMDTVVDSLFCFFVTLGKEFIAVSAMHTVVKINTDTESLFLLVSTCIH